MYSLSYLYVPYDIEMIGEKERERDCTAIVEKSIISSGLDPPSTLKDVCLL